MTNPLQTQIGGSHYKNFEYQPIEFFMDMKLNFIQCNIIKYIVRHRSKNGIEDVKKAKHYAEIAKELKVSVESIMLDDTSLVFKFSDQIKDNMDKTIVEDAIFSKYSSVILHCNKLINSYE